MGERAGRTTRRFDNRSLIELTKPTGTFDQAELADEQDDPFAEWDDTPSPVPAGSQSKMLPTTSRTATVVDPLTTGLLAEVARRSQTMEIEPDEVAQLTRNKRDTLEIDPQTLQAALKKTK